MTERENEAGDGLEGDVMGVVSFPLAPPVAPWDTFLAARTKMLQAFAAALEDGIPADELALIPDEIGATCSAMKSLVALLGDDA